MSSGGEVRRVSPRDIQLVQNLIERCLQLYMNQKEVVDTLLEQARIEPGFTELVWQKLEEENREFFKAYYVRLKVKHQIAIFNKLLDQQVELMREIGPAGGSRVTMSNGSSYSPSLNQSMPCYVPEATVRQTPMPDNMNHHIGCSPGTLINGGPAMQQNLHAVHNSSAHAGKVDMPANIHSLQTSYIGMLHGMNGTSIKSEAGCSNTSGFAWNERDGNGIDMRPTIGDPCVTTFNGPDSNTEALNDSSLLEADTSSFGCLGGMPRNFSLSDLTSISSGGDILGSYSRSPYLPPDSFLDSSREECQEKRLDTISGGRNYNNFED